MRVAVYGGSFNPPHVVHLMVASWLRWTDRCDELWCVPVCAHPFDKDLAPYDERLAWCSDAARGSPFVRVDDGDPKCSTSAAPPGAVANRVSAKMM